MYYPFAPLLDCRGFCFILGTVLGNAAAVLAAALVVAVGIVAAAALVAVVTGRPAHSAQTRSP
tara:strand:+ start:16566 stop:16754 length:189 start_codon:yes stop_codon:yes gene_type:complete